MEKEMLKNLLSSNRSYRRFREDERIPQEQLEEWVGLTRFCASARNAQPLKYISVRKEEMCEKVFNTLAWAGYLTDWDGPEKGERPSAYLIQLLDTRISENCLCDDGIQIQTILLAAVEKGYGGCVIKAFQNEKLREILQLPDYVKINYVIALGKPCETVVIEEMRENEFKYWRDAEQIHHVPKRNLNELLFKQE